MVMVALLSTWMVKMSFTVINSCGLFYIIISDGGLIAEI